MTILLKGGTVATGYPLKVFRADVMIDGQSIARVAADIAVEGPGVECIDCSRMLVTPGFVNGHIHLNQVLNRGALDELSTEGLLSSMHSRHEAKTDADRYWGSLLSIAEALSSGTTFFSAFASDAGLIGQAMHDAGVRGTLTVAKKDQWAGDGHQPDMSKADKILVGLDRALAEWCLPRVSMSIGAASDRSASRGLLDGLRNLAKEAGCRIYMHVAEGEESVRLSMKHRGRRPITFLSDIGFLAENFTIVHACHIDADEISRVADSGACICHCPVSNAKSAAGTFPLGDANKAGIAVCLGTDSASTGNTNNVLVEGYFASLLCKAQSSQATFPDAEEVFAMLTVKGARAVGMEGQIGEVAAGKKADVVLWDLSQPAFLPYRGTPVGTLVYCASEVRASKVIVDGELIFDETPRLFSLGDTMARLATYR